MKNQNTQLRKFELNGLGEDWIFEAQNEEEATQILIDAVCGAKKIEEYEEYCEEVNVNPDLHWKEVSREEIKEIHGEEAEDFLVDDYSALKEEEEEQEGCHCGSYCNYCLMLD